MYPNKIVLIGARPILSREGTDDYNFRYFDFIILN